MELERQRVPVAWNRVIREAGSRDDVDDDAGALGGDPEGRAEDLGDAAMPGVDGFARFAGAAQHDPRAVGGLVLHVAECFGIGAVEMQWRREHGVLRIRQPWMVAVQRQRGHAVRAPDVVPAACGAGDGLAGVAGQPAFRSIGPVLLDGAVHDRVVVPADAVSVHAGLRVLSPGDKHEFVRRVLARGQEMACYLVGRGTDSTGTAKSSDTPRRTRAARTLAGSASGCRIDVFISVPPVGNGAVCADLSDHRLMGSYGSPRNQ